MDPKDGPQNGPKDGSNPNPRDCVLALEAPPNYRVAPRTESSTPATGTPPPFAPVPPSATPATGMPPVGMAQQSSTPATGTPPVEMAQESSTQATGNPAFASPGPKRRPGRPRMYHPPTTQSPSGGPQSPSGGRQPPSGSRQPPSGPHGNGLEFPGEGISLFTGGTFVPHVLIVNPGEDVSEKIQSLSDEGPQSIVVICGSGYISKASIRQTECCGGRLSFEGRFQIVSLSGSFISTELLGLNVGFSVGLSISLASADGRLIGGMVAGELVAASPIQIVLGSFLPRVYKEPKQRKKKSAYKPAPPAATMGPMPSSITPNFDHPIFEGNEQSHHGGGAVAGTSTTGPMPLSSTPNVDHSNFDEVTEQSPHGGADEAGKSNAGVGGADEAGTSNAGIGSSLSDMNFVDWGAMNLDSDMARKSTTDMNVSP